MELIQASVLLDIILKGLVKLQKEKNHKLFSPLTTNMFFNTVYETRWEHFKDLSNDFCSLFQSSDLEEYLFKSRAWETADPWAKAGVLSAKFPNGGKKIKGASVEDVLALFADGHTIVLQQSQKRWKRLADFCNILSATLNARVGANIYITPPNSQGFTAHYDMHDVLLLQTEGTKIWKVKPFDKVPLTIVGDEFEQEFPDLELCDSEGSTELSLEAGQRLYMPRGTIHQGIAFSDKPSVHITFGIKPVTWYDLISLQVFHPENLSGDLLKSVPFDVLESLQESKSTAAVKKFSQKLKYNDIDDGLMKYLHQRVDAVSPRSRFESINKLSELTCRSQITYCQVIGTEILSDSWFAFGGRKIAIPADFLVFLKRSLEMETFRLDQICDPTQVNPIPFANWLIRSGFATFN
jgi:hypothetical protein